MCMRFEIRLSDVLSVYELKKINQQCPSEKKIKKKKCECLQIEDLLDNFYLKSDYQDLNQYFHHQ